MLSLKYFKRFDTVFQTSGSCDTITSSSSAEGDLDPHGSPYLSGSAHRGDNSAIQYSNLLDDDDSGIVIRTNSQSSLDKTKFESSYQYKSETESSKSVSEQNLPPPRPAPRKSVTPSAGSAVEDKLIGHRPVARERPKPAPRRLSYEQQTAGPFGDNRPTTVNEPLIDFGANTNVKSSLVEQFDNLDASGDYVYLKQTKPMTNQNENWDHGNKRYSISRTPAMKYGQNETPKRPSIRRERSPISPDESPNGSFLDFDPLASNQKTRHTAVVESKTETVKTDQSDSLLKDWDIGQLTSVINTPKNQPNRASYVYGHPTPPPRQTISPGMTQQFYTPQPAAMTHRQTGSHSSALGFHNPVSSMHSPVPQVPPRPKNRPSPGTAGAQTVNKSDDPFADLLNLNQSSSAKTPQSSVSWETFN